MAKEKVERLAIQKDTLRELYLKSGNQCAFPGCTRVMINVDGVFVGQMCHIEAAEEGGQRFNAHMTNEQRRQFANLMLMCYEHHIVTNDVAKYPVSLLSKIKATHEQTFSDPGKIIDDAIQDKGEVNELKQSTSLNSLNALLGWNNNDVELAESIKELKWTSSRIQKLPIRTRQLLVIMVKRLKRIGLRNGGYRYDYDLIIREIAEACDLPRKDVGEHIAIMEKYSIANGYLDDDGERLPIEKVDLCEAPGGWFVFGDLLEYSKRSGRSLYNIIVDLRFDLLD